MTGVYPSPCGAGRDIGTDLAGWDKPCESLAETSVWIKGIRPDDFPIYLCMEHRTMLDALGMIEPEAP